LDLIEGEGGHGTLFTHPRVVAKGRLQAVDEEHLGFKIKKQN
jgi:hypothetical protein